MRKRIFSLLGVALVCALGYAFLSVNLSIQSRRPMPTALALLESDAEVRVTDSDWIVLEPAEGEPDTGLILYPGGFVDVRAYAPIARLVAERGFLVVLVEPPMATALLAVNDVEEITAAYPEIDHWAVGGHSLGGVAAAQAADRYPELLGGLVLIASTPAQDVDFSDSTLDVLVIIGSADQVFSSSSLDEDLLPNTYTRVEIEGGNHAQFGRYGDGTQNGDGQAAIPREQQELETAEHTVIFLRGLGR